MANKYLDSNGLLYFWQKIKNLFVSDVTYDSTSKKIQKTKAGTVSDVVTLATVATSGSYSDLSNKPTIPAAVQPTTTTPKMDGIAAVGSETKYAKGDHVHPSDTSRVPVTRTIAGKPLSSNITLVASDAGVVSSTITIQTSNWIGTTATVSVSGVTASNTVVVAPAPASIADWNTFEVKCTGQGAGTLTFTAAGTPDAAIVVNLIIIT